jgi:hypothetical protein
MIQILKSKTMNGCGAFGIFKSGDQTYIVPSWTKVPAGTKKEDVVVIDDGPAKPIVEPKFSKHTVKGSTGKIYEVVIDSKYGNSCTCPGFGYHRTCKHIKQIVTD